MRANSSLCICFLIAFSPKSSTCQRDCALIPFPMDSISTETATVCQQSQSDVPKRQNLGRLHSQTPTINIFKNKQKVGFGQRTRSSAPGGNSPQHFEGLPLGIRPVGLVFEPRRHQPHSSLWLLSADNPTTPRRFPRWHSAETPVLSETPVPSPLRPASPERQTHCRPALNRQEPPCTRPSACAPDVGRQLAATNAQSDSVLISGCRVSPVQGVQETFVIPRNNDLCFPCCHISL